jgi:hypothetical protein
MPIARLKPGRLLLAVLALSALLALSACSPYLDAGPTPARLTVSVQAHVTPAQLKEGVYDRLGPPPFTPGMFHWLAPQPVWDWGVYWVKGEMDLWPLQPVPPAQVKSVPGLSLKQAATFLAPPGKRTYRILVDSYLEHTWSEGLGSWREFIPISFQQIDMELDLKPGEDRKRVAAFEPFQPVR